MKNKLIAMVLVTAMAIGVTACGGSKTEDASSDSGETTTISDSAEEVGEVAPVEESESLAYEWFDIELPEGYEIEHTVSLYFIDEWKFKRPIDSISSFTNYVELLAADEYWENALGMAEYDANFWENNELIEEKQIGDYLWYRTVSPDLGEEKVYYYADIADGYFVKVTADHKYGRDNEEFEKILTSMKFADISVLEAVPNQ